MPCHALHVPQHVAESLSEPLNQMISSAPSNETVFAYPDTQALFWNNIFLDELLVTAEELHPPFLRFCLETCKLLGGLSTKTNEFPCPASKLLDGLPSKANEPRLHRMTIGGAVAVNLS